MPGSGKEEKTSEIIGLHPAILLSRLSDFQGELYHPCNGSMSLQGFKTA
jgi:hypothetical protein